MKESISISLCKDLIKTIDTLRTLAKRSTFIQYLILLGVEVHNEKKKEEASVKVRR